MRSRTESTSCRCHRSDRPGTDDRCKGLVEQPAMNPPLTSGRTALPWLRHDIFMLIYARSSNSHVFRAWSRRLRALAFRAKTAKAPNPRSFLDAVDANSSRCSSYQRFFVHEFCWYCTKWSLVASFPASGTVAPSSMPRRRHTVSPWLEDRGILNSEVMQMNWAPKDEILQSRDHTRSSVQQCFLVARKYLAEKGNVVTGR